jgi:hypothetical protein
LFWSGDRRRFAELKGPVKDPLRRYGLYERVGDHGFSPTIGVAVDNCLRDTSVEWVDWTDPGSAVEGEATS